MRLALLISFSFAAAALLSGCGSSDDDIPPPECTGSSCACPAGEACDLGGSQCEGDSCSLAWVELHGHLQRVMLAEL